MCIPIYDERQISIPASHAGGDSKSHHRTACKPYFNPRLPCGRRRSYGRSCESEQRISIPASHAGGDKINCNA